MFYDNFQKICEYRNISISSVLDQAGLSRGNLARWKSGITPKIGTLLKLSEILNVPVSVLNPEIKPSLVALTSSQIEEFIGRKDEEFQKYLRPGQRKGKDEEYGNFYELDQIEIELLKRFSALNSTGQRIAMERVEELGKIPDYQKEGRREEGD